MALELVDVNPFPVGMPLPVSELIYVLEVCPAPNKAQRERVLHRQPTGPNLFHHRDDFSEPAWGHGRSNSFFQVALYLPA